MYTTLLWATDGSPESDAALDEAVRLLHEGGRLVAFHCDQRFYGSHAAGLPVLPDEADRVRHVEQQVQELRDRGIDVRLVIERTAHEPAQAIVAASNDERVDAIVCGTRGLNALFELVQGSVAARVLRHASVPVVVVPHAVLAHA